MRYEERIIDEVQAANDIVDVISQYMSLKKGGRNFKAVCPFHQEKTPSFMVSAEKQIFHCFGCGAGGDVIGFVMKQENMTFVEAVRRLAERAGIRLPEPTFKKGEGEGEKEKIYEIYRLASSYYHEQFCHPEKGRAARDYFYGRGFEAKLADEFQLGWASESWRELFEHLVRKGFSEEILVRSRLVQRSEKGHFYDTFRGRLLFPIHNLQGKVVAFGGRLLGQGEGPKYLNSPENPVFFKRRELFGLHLARKFVDREHPQILVVEGYVDYLRLYACGFRHAVATLGTSVTEDHVRVLRRFAEEAIVIYDGDAAGEAASLRGLDVFLEEGMPVRLVRLNRGLDPDDFLRQHGPEEFRRLVESAQDFFDYKLQVLTERHRVREPAGLVRVTGELFETLARVKNPLLADRYLKTMSSALGVDERSLRGEWGKLVKRDKENVPRVGTSPAWEGAAPREEILLLGLLLEDASLRGPAFEQIAESEFENPGVREALETLRHWHADGRRVEWAPFLSRLRDESLKQELARAASLEWSEDQRGRAVSDCIRKVKQRQLQRRLGDLRRDISLAEKAGDAARVHACVREYQSLLGHRG